MYDAIRVKTLYTRRRRLIAALADMDRRANNIRRNLADVEADLGQCVLFVPPVVRRAQPSVVSRELLDYLHGCDRAQSTQEITRWVIQRRGVEIVTARHAEKFQNRVWRVLTVLRERGVVECEVESRRVLRWRLISDEDAMI